MTNRFATRRDVLQLGAVSTTVAVAGCTLPEGDDSTARLDSTANLEFDDVDADVRERTEIVYERVVSLVDREIDTTTTIRVDAPEEVSGLAHSFGSTRTQVRAHEVLAVGDDVETVGLDEMAGHYDPASNTVRFIAADADSISDELLAHELFHAIQFQSNDVEPFQRGWSAGVDRFWAERSLVEGSAQFLESTYAGGCDGEFASCRLRDSVRPDSVEWGTTVALVNGPYSNGHDFAAALFDRDGWDAIWDAHEDPPSSTGQVLKPEWYPDREPATVTVENQWSDDWIRIGRERLGMQSVFVTLWLAGALEDDAPLAGEPAAEGDISTEYIRYRSSVTDAWRGDEFVTFERNDGSDGWLWRIRWADSGAAEDAYEAFRTWAGERGEATDEDGVWAREERYETVVLDGEDVLIGSAPERDAFESLSPALR